MKNVLKKRQPLKTQIITIFKGIAKENTFAYYLY